MTSTNAPQPTPTTGVAEVFDDTIQPAPPTVSADGGVGPNNMEAPMHAGSMNSFDAKYYTHWMGLTDLTWDVSQSAGQLLWSVPIHPDRSHQWLSWDAKKYYVWAGGFDYCVKVAGTGFHAGAVVCVRIPPGFSPGQFRTFNDLTCFDYKIIDPKTLEITSAGVMDQRNIMYHYFPLDLQDKNSYGGHFAIYVMLPLKTSGSGVSQISLQIFTRPSRNFTMDQLRPIRKEASTITKPLDLEYALDFTRQKSSPQTLTAITGMTAYTKKTLVELSYQTLNTVGFDGNYLNGDHFPRLTHIEWFELNTAEKRLSDITTEKIWWSVDTTTSNTRYYLSFPSGDSIIYLHKLCFFPNDTDSYYNPIGVSTGKVYLKIGAATSTEKERVFVFNVDFKQLSDEEKQKGYTVKAVLKDVTASASEFIYYAWQDGYIFKPTGDTAIDTDDNKKYIKAAAIELDNVVWDMTYKKYAPPIDESIVTFQTPYGDVSMPNELVTAMQTTGYKDTITPQDSLVFELWDEIAALPVMPLRLSYKGIITTLPQSSDRIFKFTDPERYKAYFIGIQPTSTPLDSGRLPLQSPRKYYSNFRTAKHYLM